MREDIEGLIDRLQVINSTWATPVRVYITGLEQLLARAKHDILVRNKMIDSLIGDYDCENCPSNSPGCGDIPCDDIMFDHLRVEAANSIRELEHELAVKDAMVEMIVNDPTNLSVRWCNLESPEDTISHYRNRAETALADRQDYGRNSPEEVKE